ncbi:MAG TPA: hypothetical protein VKQ72_21810 [Aggregatilineales bacterium]|nr:hypothetical protein [Aggregatilineales bacterium]
MTKADKANRPLTVANHSEGTAYWLGSGYTLSMSFDTLRDKQWQRLMHVIWEHPALYGPLRDRYAPGEDPTARLPIEALPPTASITQHGQIRVGEAVVGCDVQATRSLFECVSIMIPITMFEGLESSPSIRKAHPELEALDNIYYDIALHVYDVLPFKIAAIGYERECQLPLELRSEPVLRHDFLLTGNFLATSDVLNALEGDLSRYQAVRADLHWLPASNLS